MKYIIGVDIGGTKINTVIMDKNARVLKKIKMPVAKGKGRQGILRQIFESVEFVTKGFSRNEIIGIGMGIPGILDSKKEKTVKLINLPQLNNVALKKIIEQKFCLKTKLDNDVKCMAIAESVFGAGKNKKSMFCLTLGTGVGGGIIINNKIYEGRGSAPEPGHLTIDMNGYKCHCGNKGCLEEYVSVRGFDKIAKKHGMNKNIIEIENMARKGSKKAREIYKELGYYLGIGLSDIVKMLDPEIIVIGGGISHASDFFMPEAIKEMSKRMIFKPCKVVASTLENNGAIGAACLFL